MIHFSFYVSLTYFNLFFLSYHIKSVQHYEGYEILRIIWDKSGSDLLVEDIWNNMNILYRKEEVSENII